VPASDSQSRASVAAGPADVLARLREDFVWATQYTLFSGIGGSIWAPRVLRRLIYTWAGARMASSPGGKFTFAGKARNLTVGSGVYMNLGVFIEATAPVTIGEESALGMEVMVLTSHHPLDEHGRWQKDAAGKPVVIGDRVWIGARAVILPGAVIENDVVIAAGAIVTGHCLAHSVYAGVPAKRIREFAPVPD
jgi:maltose O-acetyltransferase